MYIAACLSPGSKAVFLGYQHSLSRGEISVKSRKWLSLHRLTGESFVNVADEASSGPSYTLIHIGFMRFYTLLVSWDGTERLFSASVSIRPI
jgi:hypothetical protein